MPQAIIIGLVNHKGGVGKSSTAVNVGAALARRGQRVLLVDCDGQGSASFHLGVKRGALDPGMADVLLDGGAHRKRRTIREVARDTPVPGLRLVTGSLDLLLADLKLAYQEDRERRIQEALRPERDQYDFILLDLPPSLGLVALNGLLAADHYLVPVAPKFLDIEGVVGLLYALNALHSLPGISGIARNLGYVFTMVDYGRGNAPREIMEMLRSSQGPLVFDTVIGANTHIAQAPSFGLPVAEKFPGSPGAVMYESLTTELLRRLGRG